MLATLKKFDPAVRTGILASYVDVLLPNPGVGDETTRPYPNDVYESLQFDICKALRIKPQDLTDEKQKVIAFLSEQIRENVLDSKRIRAVRDRVGQKGALPLPSYEIKFTNAFVETNESLGVKRSFVLAACKDPDSVEHFVPVGLSSSETPCPSIITKTFRGTNPFVLLILALREKSVLRVDGAWLIYHSDVDLSGSYEASDVLKRFIDVYGLNIKIWSTHDPRLNAPSEKLVLNEEFRVAPLANNEIKIKLDYINEPPDTIGDVKFRFEARATSTVVAYAFAVNITKYEKDLRRHGVTITRKRWLGLRLHTDS